jgi:hypothetical protein
VGAEVAFTGGEKLLPPDGLMLFSVGVGAADDVVGVVLEGLGDSLLPHAVNVPIAMIALPPATSASWRVKRDDFMVLVLSNPRSGPVGFAGLCGSNANVNIVEHSGQTLGTLVPESVADSACYDQ